MTWSRATTIAGSAVVMLAGCRIRIVRGHREPPETAGRWRLARPACEGSRLLQLTQSQTQPQLKARGHDDHPNVGNLIGYSYCKPGDYKFSQGWYERAR